MDIPFDDLVSQALRLSPNKQAILLENLALALRQHVSSDEQNTAPRNVDTLFQSKPLSPEEVVAQGLLGTWAHVSDGAEWVNEQKQKRKAGKQWKFQAPS